MYPQYPPDVLARTGQLPVKPAAVTLTGELVTLTPMDLGRDLDALFAVSSGAPFTLGARAVPAYDPDEKIWRYMFGGPFTSAAEMRPYLQKQLDAPDGLPFTVRDRATGTPIGVLNYMANQPLHLKLELGSIWYGPIAQRTGASREATRLAMAHAFALGYLRVEWKCNNANEASKRAALSYGFTFEGVQDAHYIVKGRRRDTAWYRILAHEFATM